MAPKGDEMDIFFPPQGHAELVVKARAVCNTCPVIEQCDEWARETGVNHGIWAGKNRQHKD